MLALVFPGQGSQKTNMGIDFYNKYSVAKQVFDEVSDILGFDIIGVIKSDNGSLNNTSNTQPALMAVSIAIMEVLQKEFGLNLSNFKYTAGHSLGEYSSLVASKSIAVKDAAKILRVRGLAMEEAAKQNAGSMLAVIGVKENEEGNLKAIIDKSRKKNEVLEIANYNTYGQIVISGNTESINDCATNIKSAGYKAIKLPVSGAFHSSLMASASAKVKEVLDNINIAKPQISFLSNVNANVASSEDDIKKLLVSCITSQVKWLDIMKYMKNDGIKTIVEVGSSNVISGLFKKFSLDINCINIEKLEDLEKIKGVI